MASRVFQLARKAWFQREEFSTVAWGNDLALCTITREHMETYGGPREITNCELCTLMEWQSRISGRNQWKPHSCGHPAHKAQMQQQCANVLKPEWLHLRRNYNFALGKHADLPGRKCLFVAGAPHLLVRHGPKTGLMLWRKRMSPYQTTFCGFGDIDRYNLKDYDFIIMTVHGQTPLLTQKGNPPIFLYCHDHHPPAIQKRAQQLFDKKPAAVLTPYPSIWNGAFSIAKQTRVIFTPFLADPFWANQNTTFKKRPYDVMVIGVAGPVYPERTAIWNLLRNTKVPFKLKLWGTPAPKVGKENISASKYAAPPLLLWSKHLSQAKICVFGQDKFGYLVNKYSEIPSACSLMVAPTVPECKLVGLKPDNNYVQLARPVKERLIPQLTELVRRFDKYKPIALRGLQWFNQRCDHWLYQHFWDEVDSLLKERTHAASH